MNKTVTVYVRSATLEKGIKNPLQIQMSNIEKYCKENNLDIKAVFQDVDSGVNPKRKGLVNMLEYLKMNPTNMVVIARMDRLSRSFVQALEIREQFDKLGVELKAIDSSSINNIPGLQLMNAILEAEPKIYNELRLSRIKAKRRTNANK